MSSAAAGSAVETPKTPKSSNASNSFVTSLQKECRTVYLDLQLAGKDFVKNVRQGKLSTDDLAFMDTLILCFTGVVGLLVPGFWTLTYGSGWGNVSAEADFCRLFGAFLLFFALFVKLSMSKWGNAARTQTLKLLTLFWGVFTLLFFLLCFYGSLSYAALLNCLVTGGLTFLHARDSKIF